MLLLRGLVKSGFYQILYGPLKAPLWPPDGSRVLIWKPLD